MAGDSISASTGSTSNVPSMSSASSSWVERIEDIHGRKYKRRRMMGDRHWVTTHEVRRVAKPHCVCGRCFVEEEIPIARTMPVARHRIRQYDADEELRARRNVAELTEPPPESIQPPEELARMQPSPPPSRPERDWTYSDGRRVRQRLRADGAIWEVIREISPAPPPPRVKMKVKPVPLAKKGEKMDPDTVQIGIRLFNYFSRQLQTYHKLERKAKNPGYAWVYLIAKDKNDVLVKAYPMHKGVRRPTDGGSCNEMTYMTGERIANLSMHAYKKGLIPMGLARVGRFEDDAHGGTGRGPSVRQITRDGGYILSWNKNLIRVEQDTGEEYSGNSSRWKHLPYVFVNDMDYIPTLKMIKGIFNNVKITSSEKKTFKSTLHQLAKELITTQGGDKVGKEKRS